MLINDLYHKYTHTHTYTRNLLAGLESFYPSTISCFKIEKRKKKKSNIYKYISVHFKVLVGTKTMYVNALQINVGLGLNRV